MRWRWPRAGGPRAFRSVRSADVTVAERGRGSRRAAVALACASIASLGLTSCSEVDPIGVTRRDGVPAVQVIRCEPVGVVSLLDSQGATQWRVRASQGSDDTEFALGIEPVGFTTEVPLRVALDPAEVVSVQVQVSGDRYPMVVEFRVRDLREGAPGPMVVWSPAINSRPRTNGTAMAAWRSAEGWFGSVAASPPSCWSVSG